MIKTLQELFVLTIMVQQKGGNLACLQEIDQRLGPSLNGIDFSSRQNIGRWQEDMTLLKHCQGGCYVYNLLFETYLNLNVAVCDFSVPRFVHISINIVYILLFFTRGYEIHLRNTERRDTERRNTERRNTERRNTERRNTK